MSYLIGLIVVLLLFLILHFMTGLSTKNTLIVTAFLIVVVLFAAYYNDLNDRIQQHILDVQVRYEQGHTLHCGSYDVNQSGFSYSVGTQTFIGLKNTAHYAVMIPATQCQ